MVHIRCRLAQYLLTERVGLVVIEATSDYWRQFYFLLEDVGLSWSMRRTPGICPAAKPTCFQRGGASATGRPRAGPWLPGASD